MTRSVAFGRFTAPSSSAPITAGRSSDLAYLKECDLVGHWGCSGGMVCQFDFVRGVLGAQVIGMCKSRSATSGQYQYTDSA